MSTFPKIYFFNLPSGPPEDSTYHHVSVSIAEGLQSLNIPFFSNIDYWKQSEIDDSYLFRQSEGVNFRDCDIVVFGYEFFGKDFLKRLPSDLFDVNRKYKLVFIDYADGLYTPGFHEKIRSVDIVLKAHFNIKYTYPSNFRPWQFGLTNRIIQAVQPLPYGQRKKEILSNFRVGHHLRYITERSVNPNFYERLKLNATAELFDQAISFGKKDYMYWCETGRRHYPSYYDRLSSSYACACFGGFVQKPQYSSIPFLNKLIERVDFKLRPLHFERIFQFDSWRFWESLVAGCCTIHIDFERYGAKLPVMPANYVHYLGVDLDNLTALRQKLEDPLLFETIGNNGKIWALEHYAPQPIAQRFLTLFQ